MTSEILNLESTINRVKRSESQIQMAMSLDSGTTTALNTESSIHMDMALSSQIDLEIT